MVARTLLLASQAARNSTLALFELAILRRKKVKSDLWFASKRRVKIGKGRNWAPRRHHEREGSNHFFSDVLHSGAKVWRRHFGNTSPELIRKIAKLLRIVDQRPGAHKLNVVNRVSLFINRLHTGWTFEHIAANFAVCEEVACRTFNIIQHMIAWKLAGEIHLPDADEMDIIRMHMRYRGADVPAALFTADGKHLSIYHKTNGSNLLLSALHCQQHVFKPPMFFVAIHRS